MDISYAVTAGSTFHFRARAVSFFGVSDTFSGTKGSSENKILSLKLCLKIVLLTYIVYLTCGDGSV